MLHCVMEGQSADRGYVMTQDVSCFNLEVNLDATSQATMAADSQAYPCDLPSSKPQEAHFGFLVWLACQTEVQLVVSSCTPYIFLYVTDR